jgi:hypothetical protein
MRAPADGFHPAAPRSSYNQAIMSQQSEGTRLDAVGVVEEQHARVERLLRAFAGTQDETARRKAFEELADELAVHFVIEALFFYPALRSRQRERGLAQTNEDHADVKRRLVEALRAADSADFAAHVETLTASALSEFEKERAEIFPSARQLFTKVELEQLGRSLEGEARTLRAGKARFHAHLTK